MQRVKLKKNSLYLMPSGSLARAIRVDSSKNLVIVYNYGSRHNETLEYEIASKILQPVFKIGEVASIVGRKPTTLRKYELQGKLPSPKKFLIGAKNVMRVYTKQDIEAVADFFSEQCSSKRSSRGNMGGPVDRQRLEKIFQTKLER